MNLFSRTIDKSTVVIKEGDVATCPSFITTDSPILLGDQVYSFILVFSFPPEGLPSF